MFFGRLDVYWPDRPAESYRLNKAIIAVGRSTGNDIVLDTTTISRYHITLTFQDQQAWLEDLESANGTYVDGVRLNPHDPVVLRGGEEIQIGEVRLIFHPPAVVESVSAEETTQRVVLSQLSCRIELEGPNIAVAPGAHAQVLLTIENISEAADRYFVEVEGLPKGWARADRVEVPLDPGEQAQVTISIKPFRRSESQPGERPFSVRVRSALRPSEVLDARTVLHVLPFSGFGMALGTMPVRSGEQFPLYLHNQGNAPLALTIQAADRARALRFDIPGAQVQLGPGERRTLTGTVSSRRPRWFGRERVLEFAVLARANDPSHFLAAVPGTCLEKRRLPLWAGLILVPVVAVLVLLGIGVVALFGPEGATPTPAPAPVIAAFALSETTAAVGEVVTAIWEVSGAQALTLVVVSARDQQVFALNPALSSHPLTLDRTGLYTVILRAENGAGSVQATVPLEVRPLVTLSVEVLGAPQLVRSVQQEVRLRWTVAGAQEYDGGYRVWLTSAQEGDLLAAPLPLTGEQIIPVTITQDVSEWLVTLYAQGHDGVVGAMSQKLVVLNPICTLQTAQTVVRSGPGLGFPAILPPQPADPAAGVVLTYSPVARDAAGAWLMVPISIDNRTGWVPLADFLCTNFDPQRLRVAGMPPLPESAGAEPDSQDGATRTLPAMVPSPTAPQG